MKVRLSPFAAWIFKADDYEAGRRKIHQLADRLRFQANFWNSNEQGFAHLLPQQLV